MQADLLTDDSSSTTTAAQVPVGAAQNLFGNILNTLEQVIGVAPGGEHREFGGESGQLGRGRRGAQCGGGGKFENQPDGLAWCAPPCARTPQHRAQEDERCGETEIGEQIADGHVDRAASLHERAPSTTMPSEARGLR